MTKWEYKIEVLDLHYTPFPTTDTLIELNQLGEQGWEAVAVWGEGDSGFVMLKREK